MGWDLDSVYYSSMRNISFIIIICVILIGDVIVGGGDLLNGEKL